MSEYLISIIMPTYNSERTIDKSLQSIRNQTIDQDKVEILVLDGGSTDKTLEIAKKYKAKVIKNERKLPEFAKQLGLMEARGRFGVFIDSDEYFANKKSLENRIRFLEKYPKVKNVVSSGQICVKGEKGICRYANYIGDPFSNFVYRFNGYNRIEDLTRQYRCENVENAYIMMFDNNDTLPLFDALGNMFDIEYARQLYYQSGENKSFAANVFANMTTDTHCAAVMIDDYIYHEPGLTSKVYLNKLKWRVKNNLFQDEGVGYSERSKADIRLKKRQYMYVFYCGLIVPVLIDSVCIALKNKDKWFIKHVFYAEYVFIMIVWFMFLKIIKYPVKLDKLYGK